MAGCQVPAGHKFVCLCTDAIGAQCGFPAIEKAALHISSDLPCDLSDFWVDGLGSFVVEDIQGKSVKVVTHWPAQELRTRNTEFAPLDAKLGHFQLAMALMGVRMGPVSVLKGATVDGITQVYTASPMARGLLQGAETQPVFCDETVLRDAIDLAATIDHIFAVKGKYSRLKRALMAVQRAYLEREDIYERLHGFVRALDGVLMTRQGKGRSDFVVRAQVMTGRVFQKLLGLAYDTRGSTEHLSDLPKALKRKRKRVSLIRFLEALCGEVLTDILRNPALLANFETDATIRAFWTSPTWPRRIHVGSVMRVRREGWKRAP